jgi:coenzyme F420-reducing hydrogenase beta subunit
MRFVLKPKEVLHSGLCIGCGSCVAQMENPAEKLSMHLDSYGQLKPQGSPEWLNRESESFAQICPFSPVAANEDQLAAALFPGATHDDLSAGRFQSAYVGYAREEDYRSRGSSGGLVTWVATELLRRGLIDGLAHVIAIQDPESSGRFFKYRISRTEEEIREGAKSRYYPIELSEILTSIREVPGRYAIVGIPCFIKAVQLLRRREPIYRERIVFTLGLFCGHMKSARFVESFAWQMKVPLDEIQQVEFRSKDSERPASWYNAALSLKGGKTVNRDWWHLADGDWGAGFFMNSACNFCDDVVAETADISFGDAWVEPYSSDSKGTNVIVIRSPVIQSLITRGIQEGRLSLEAVNGAFVERTQAAGLRQRREGLAYRLAWPRSGLQPIKRVHPEKQRIAGSRKVIYRMRFQISAWSHRVFLLARVLRYPPLYVLWARVVAAIYHAVAYHKGKPKEIWKRFSELK